MNNEDVQANTFYILEIPKVYWGLDNYWDEKNVVHPFSKNMDFSRLRIKSWKDLHGLQVKVTDPGAKQEEWIMIPVVSPCTKMIITPNCLTPHIIPVDKNGKPICICPITITIAVGCLCGAFQKEQQKKKP